MKSEEVYSYSRLMEQQYFITAGYFIADTIQVYHLYNILKFSVLQGTKALIELAKNVFLKYPIKSFFISLGRKFNNFGLRNTKHYWPRTSSMYFEVL